MNTFYDIESIKEFLQKQRKHNNSIGLVPTMGALHEGHLALAKESLAENDLTVCTIFVNPIQFNNPQDLKKYPRNPAEDLEKLKNIGVQVAFCPSEETMYPENSTMTTNMGYLDEIMEGKYRPGHFNGVRMIVAKLFNILKPDRAYFGQKDLQQFVIIKKMNALLNFGIDVKCVKTIRNESGLALSSRNQLLTEEQRNMAAKIYQMLHMAKVNLLNGKSVTDVKKQVVALIGAIGPDIRLEYFEIVDTDTLKKIDPITSQEKGSLCMAVYIGNVRLIDNISLI